MHWCSRAVRKKFFFSSPQLLTPLQTVMTIVMSSVLPRRYFRMSLSALLHCSC